MNKNSPTKIDMDVKTEFRKPSNDTSNRKYRHHSPSSGSSSYSESPEREQSMSPVRSRKKDGKALGSKHRNDVERETDIESGRNPYPRDRDTHRSGHNKHDDHSKHHKNDDEDNHHKYQALSSRSGRESRSSTHSGNKREIEYNKKYKDHVRDDDKHYYYDVPRHRSKEKEGNSSFFIHKKHKERDLPRGWISSSNAESRCNESRRHLRKGDTQDERRDYHKSYADTSFDREKSSWNVDDHKQLDWPKQHCKDHRGDDVEINGEKCQFQSGIGSMTDGRSIGSDRHRSNVKKSKMSVPDNYNDSRDDAVGDGKDIDSSILSDVNTAKVAAMKAAELVNRNLAGVGGLSTDQKKKLLWGNKKTTPEESSHRWDTALFSDRERQEKFNKLMSLRLAWWLWPIVGCERGGESGEQCRRGGKGDYPDGETEGDAAGSGEAVHRRTEAKGWPNCGAGSLAVPLCRGAFSLFILVKIAGLCRHSADVFDLFFPLLCFYFLDHF